jgi:hypothetical protein
VSRTKFEAAREFIKEKRYAEARTILKTIDHPTATEWLQKIDRLDPPGSSPPPPKRDPSVERITQANTHKSMYGLISKLRKASLLAHSAMHHSRHSWLQSAPSVRRETGGTAQDTSPSASSRMAARNESSSFIHLIMQISNFAPRTRLYSRT